jgi:N-acetylmuramoyl-L-alanine amidase
MAENSSSRGKLRSSSRAGFIAACAVVMFWLTGPVSALTFSRVIIDAGHGGVDGGTVWNGLIERNLTLDVAKRVESLLKARGLSTVMTRRSNVTVSLDARARIANRYSSAVFVSIHFNADRNRSVTGFETFYRSARGRTLAASVQRSLDHKVTGRNRGIRYRDYSVLRSTRMPAVLVECGFISNKTEASRCASSSHRQKLAEAIVAGILASRG